MLKNLLLPVNYNESISQTCGEIVCNGFNKFFINCNLCKLKIFDYYEFVEHIQNNHLRELLLETQKSNHDDNEEVDNEYNRRILKVGEDEEKEMGQVSNENYKNIKSEQVEDDLLDVRWNDVDMDRHENNDDDNEQEMDNRNEEEEITVLKKNRKPKELPCEICGKLYADSKRLKMHITVAHVKEKPFKCTFCSESFCIKRSLDHHIKIAHTGYKCHICGKVVRTKPSLNRHVSSHSDERPHVCTEENCGKAFLTRRQLKNHQVQHKEPELMCEECGFKCFRRESLIVHQRNHTGEKPYACEQCDRRFTTNSLLCEHRGSHAERKHTCDVCGKSFNRPKALYHHKHLHLGIKKFVCKICGAAYAQAAGLSAHMRKHREEGPNVGVMRDDDGSVSFMKAKDITNNLHNY